MKIEQNKMKQLVFEFPKQKEVIRFVKDDKYYLYTNLKLVIFDITELIQPFNSLGILRLRQNLYPDIYFVSANELIDSNTIENDYYINKYYISYQLLPLHFNELMKFLYET